MSKFSYGDFFQIYMKFFVFYGNYRVSWEIAFLFPIRRIIRWKITGSPILWISGAVLAVVNYYVWEFMLLNPIFMITRTPYTNETNTSENVGKFSSYSKCGICIIFHAANEFFWKLWRNSQLVSFYSYFVLRVNTSDFCSHESVFCLLFLIRLFFQ